MSFKTESEILAYHRGYTRGIIVMGIMSNIVWSIIMYWSHQ